MAIWLWQRSAEGGEFLSGSILLAYFGLVLVIDLEHRLILHPVSLAGAMIALGAGLWRHNVFTTITGGLAGFTIMFGLYLLGGVFARLFIKRTLTPFDEVALGFGDVTLSAVIGLTLGWPGVVAALLLGVLAAGLFSSAFLLIMLARRRYVAFTPIPYGPFLVLGALLVYFGAGARLLSLAPG